MNIIYKYELELREMQTVSLPMAFRALTVQMQNDKLYLWAKVDSNFPTKPVRFFIYGTGMPMPDEDTWYLGTVQDDAFVWHVFMEDLIA